MLTLNQLTAIAEVNRVDVKTVERDYVLTHLLQRLSSLEASESLTFKGGTALRTVHFQTFRYSADIDLNVNTNGFTDSDALALVAETANMVEADLGLSISVEDELILYTGPRNQVEPERVKLDIATDEIATDETVRRPLVIRYPDQLEVTSLPTYSLVEVAAEKLRCVMQRLQCRDLFDIHRLLVNEGTDPTDLWGQFVLKARHRGLDPDLFSDWWQRRKEQYRQRWDIEMARYTGDVPHYDQVLRETERAFRPLLKG